MFRPVISRALGPTSVTRQRIYRTGSGGEMGIRRLLSSDGGREDGSERPRFDLGWKDIAELNGVCASLLYHTTVNPSRVLHGMWIATGSMYVSATRKSGPFTYSSHIKPSGARASDADNRLAC